LRLGFEFADFGIGQCGVGHDFLHSRCHPELVEGSLSFRTASLPKLTVGVAPFIVFFPSAELEHATQTKTGMCSLFNLIKATEPAKALLWCQVRIEASDFHDGSLPTVGNVVNDARVHSPAEFLRLLARSI